MKREGRHWERSDCPPLLSLFPLYLVSANSKSHGRGRGGRRGAVGRRGAQQTVSSSATFSVLSLNYLENEWWRRRRREMKRWSSKREAEKAERATVSLSSFTLIVLFPTSPSLSFSPSTSQEDHGGREQGRGRRTLFLPPPRSLPFPSSPSEVEATRTADYTTEVEPKVCVGRPFKPPPLPFFYISFIAWKPKRGASAEPP